MTTIQENKIQTDTVELQNSALVELLEGASTHSSKDKSLYSLNSVQLEGEGAGYLVARATDRYRLIEGKIETEHGQLSKSLISLADVKRVIELCKSNKLSKVTLNRIGDLLTVSVTGSSITVQLLDANYPATFDDLLNKSEGEPSPIEGVAFNPAFMADYGKIAGKGEAIKIYFTGKNKPMRVRITSDKILWRALLMPMSYKD